MLLQHATHALLLSSGLPCCNFSQALPSAQTTLVAKYRTMYTVAKHAKMPLQWHFLSATLYSALHLSMRVSPSPDMAFYTAAKPIWYSISHLHGD